MVAFRLEKEGQIFANLVLDLFCFSGLSVFVLLFVNSRQLVCQSLLHFQIHLAHDLDALGLW
jgi:hypothetical protein